MADNTVSNHWARNSLHKRAVSKFIPVRNSLSCSLMLNHSSLCLSPFRSILTQETDTTFTLQNYFRYQPAKPYTILTSSVTLTCQFSKLPLSRASAKKLVSHASAEKPKPQAHPPIPTVTMRRSQNYSRNTRKVSF